MPCIAPNRFLTAGSDVDELLLAAETRTAQLLVHSLQNAMESSTYLPAEDRRRRVDALCPAGFHATGKSVGMASELSVCFAVTKPLDV